MDGYCKPCRAEYGREHYMRNKARYIEKAKQRTQRVLSERMVFIVAFLREHPCVDCGENDPLVLEFDHQRDKEFDIALGLREKNWDAVLAEIEKCEVVCANCHRRRTARIWGYTRFAAVGADPQLPLFTPR